MLNLSLGLGLGSYATLNKGGGVARRLLDLLKNDVGTALFAPYSQTDRLSNLFNGGGEVAGDGYSIAMELETSRWNGRSREAYLASQPSRTVANAYEPVDTNGIVPATDVTISVVDDLTIPLPHKKAYQFANAGASNRFPFFTTSGVIAGRIYEWSGWVKAAAAHDNTIGFEAGASQLYPFTTEWTFVKIYMKADSNDQRPWFRVAASQTIFVTGARLREISRRYARQGASASRFKWYFGAKPYALLDGVDDFEDTETLYPGSTGTMVSAFRPETVGGARNMFFLAGGTATGDKRARLAVGTTGRPTFSLNAAFNTAGSADVYGQDLVMVQTWGGGRRRCYVTTLPDPLFLDEAFTPNMDGTGNTYKIGCLETPGEYAKGRLYGTLIRAVETSDADVRNIILPYFKGLMP